ncbi:MAG: type II secretion system protein [Verrucomicrobiota bacterium]|nr:type II secretion system protein [Verrucomicrobiota bacterium]
MKIFVCHFPLPGGAASPLAAAGAQRTARPTARSGFTMVEIAISLAIIGIALVAIIGVLPMGVNVQKQNREETIVDQDATVLMNAIRNGALGSDELTNYVFAVTNFWGLYNANGAKVNSGANYYSYANSQAAPSPRVFPQFNLDSGSNIVALLSTPEYQGNFGVPLDNLSGGGYSNHIVACVHSISGPASEKPPQNNDIVVGDSFSYKVVCANLPVAVETNLFYLPTNDPAYGYGRQLTANLHELRLTFLWPLYPNGGVGNGRQTFRTLVPGRLAAAPSAPGPRAAWIHFFQPQAFTNAP